MSRSLLLASLLFGATAWAFTACGSDEADGGSFCEAGTVTYCKCRGGSAGTRQCNAEGTAFDTCVSDETLEACEELVDPTTGPGSTGTGTGTGTGGAGGGGTGTKTLFEPCAEGGECKSGSCAMGFCTQPCASWQECVDGETQGECTTPPGLGATCVPYCQEQADCTQYGTASLCGYSLATDGFAIVVCADWGASLAPPPDGWECADDWDCHLGHSGLERICLFEECTSGCFEPADCPAPLECSASGGNPGTCN